MTLLIAVDPGPHESAVVSLNESGVITMHDKWSNDRLLVSLSKLSNDPKSEFVFEMIASYGRPVGSEVFETCVWIGRFMQATNCMSRMYRNEVKVHLCGSANKVNDGVIRQRLIDIYGGKDKAIGKKQSPGPLFGVVADEWQALALGVSFGELKLGWKIR